MESIKSRTYIHHHAYNNSSHESNKHSHLSRNGYELPAHLHGAAYTAITVTIAITRDQTSQIHHILFLYYII